MNDRLPYLKIYPGDFYRSEVPGLPIEAQWLYFRLIILMHDAERVGYLSVNGSPIPPESIVRKVGAITLEQYESLLGVLLATSIFESAPDGIIFSKEIVAAERRRKEASKAGKLGGNPMFTADGAEDPASKVKGEVNRPLNPTLKAPLKAPLKPKSYSYSDSEAERKEDTTLRVVVNGAPAPPTPARRRTPHGQTKERFALLVQIWNQEIGSKLPVPKFVNPKREAATKRMFAGYETEDEVSEVLRMWRDTCKRIATSSFCLGGGDRGWKASVDWAMRPDVMARLLEGAFDDSAKPGTGGGSSEGNGGGRRARAGPDCGHAPNARLGSENSSGCYRD